MKEDPNRLTVPWVHTDLGLSSFSPRRVLSVLGLTLFVAIFAVAVGPDRGRGESASRPAARPAVAAAAGADETPMPVLLSDASVARR